MASEVQLPQLGESVTEGVITAWLVEVGDDVEVDQPIAEISTDKVDTEIPSPVAGKVAELKADVDDTIEVGQVIAVIEDGGTGDGGGGAGDEADEADGQEPGDEADEADGREPGDEQAEGDRDQAEADQGDGDGAQKDRGEPEDDRDRQGTQASAETTEQAATSDNGQVEGTKALTSPLVRKLLREAGIEPSQVRGTGSGGRITREDAQRAIESGGEAKPAEPAAVPTGEQARAAVVTPPPVQAVAGRSRPEASPTQIDFAGESEVEQDLTRVRKVIAKSMLESLQTTAQLTAAVEVDLTSMMNLRAAKKDAFRTKEGVSLSPLPMIARAACMVIPRHPTVNSSIDTDAGTATFHNYINLGMAVDTERGLLVPNIKDAHDLNVPGMARKIADIATRTRNKKLQPDEISGGTFTITNTGSRGTLFDTPILNPPEVAILATCAIEKRPVVVSDEYGDSIAIRWMTYLCMTYDHRMLDRADAARFLQDLKYVLETHDFASELGV